MLWRMFFWHTYGLLLQVQCFNVTDYWCYVHHNMTTIYQYYNICSVHQCNKAKIISNLKLKICVINPDAIYCQKNTYTGLLQGFLP